MFMCVVLISPYQSKKIKKAFAAHMKDNGFAVINRLRIGIHSKNWNWVGSDEFCIWILKKKKLELLVLIKYETGGAFHAKTIEITQTKNNEITFRPSK